MIKQILFLAVVSVSVACGTPEETGDCEAGARTGYPASPYGVTEGSVIENLELVAPDGSAFHLGDIHTDGGNRLLLVATAAGWCTSCVEEQPKLQDLFERYGDRCLAVLVALFEDASFNSADADFAEQWKTQYGLSFDVVADPGFLFDDYYDSSLTPMTMFIDVPTMEIIEIGTGWDQGKAEAIIESRL